MRRGTLSGDDRAPTAQMDWARAAGASAAGRGGPTTWQSSRTPPRACRSWPTGSTRHARPGDRPRPRVPALRSSRGWGVAEAFGASPSTSSQPLEGPGGASPLEAFEAALVAGGGRVRVVALSWVQYSRGWCTDLAALSASATPTAPLLCADVIQGVGVIPAELATGESTSPWPTRTSGCSAPRASGCCSCGRVGPTATGPEPGWASVVHRWSGKNTNLIYDDSARRYEGGTFNLTGAVGMGASLDLLAAASGGRGVEAIWEHVDGLAARLTRGLTEAGATVLSDRSPSARSGIVTFAVEGRAPQAVVETLAAAGVVASPRGGGTPASPLTATPPVPTRSTPAHPPSRAAPPLDRPRRRP